MLDMNLTELDCISYDIRISKLSELLYITNKSKITRED